MPKRANAVTFKGKPFTLVGPQLKVGDKAPDFSCVTGGLELVGLGQTPAKARLFSVVPSLDTGVCSEQWSTAKPTISPAAQTPIKANSDNGPNKL